MQPHGQAITCSAASTAEALACTCLQAQAMVMDTLGLATCVALTWAVRNNARGRVALPLIILPIFGVGDLSAIYAELKSVHLRIMNRERAEMIAEAWLASGQVPTAKQVGTLEIMACFEPSARG